MTPAELAKKDEFYSIYWSEYNLVKESGSPELYDKIHNRNNYADSVNNYIYLFGGALAS